MGLRRVVTIGTSVLGNPIEAIHFTPPGYAKPRPAALLFAALRGDEPSAQLMLERLADELVERPPGRDTWIVPCANPDGLLAGTRNNARDVDLDGNFAATSWVAPRRGGAPEDQPETQALVALIERVGAERLIAVQVTHARIGWAGRGEELARACAERAGYPLQVGGTAPGSFGAKYGVDRALEVVEIESPYLMPDEAAWLECRTALRWCVDLPD